MCAPLTNFNLSEPLSISLNIRPHLREPLIELRIHRPVLQISVIPLEQWTGVMKSLSFIEEEGVFKCKWPIKS